MKKVIKKIIALQLVLITIIAIVIFNNQIIEKSNIAKKLNEGTKQASTDKTFTEDDFPYNIKFKDIAAGSDFSIALDEEGYLWTWGRNAYNTSDTWHMYGILGEDPKDIKSRSYPKKISSKKISKIYAQGVVAFAIDEEGFLYSWGSNERNLLGNGNIGDYKSGLTGIRTNLYFSKVDIAGR